MTIAANVTTDKLRTVMELAGVAQYQAAMALGSASVTRLGQATQNASVRTVGLAVTQKAASAAAREMALAEGAAAAGGVALSAALGPVLIVVTAIAAVATALGIGLAAAAAAAAKASEAHRKFQKELTDINTQAGYTKESMLEMEQAILRVDSALSHADLAGAVKPFAFAGWGADEALDAGKVAAAAAEAYGVETAAAGDAMLKTMEAFAVAKKDALYVMDLIAKAAAGGTMEVSDLSKFIPRVASSAAGAGVSIEDTFASLEAISFYAGTAEEGTSLLKSMYESLAMAGYETQLSSEGLLSVLQDLWKQTGGNRAELQKLVGSQEAVNAISKLATDDFARLKKSVEDMAGASGTTAAGLAERRGSMENALQRTTKALQDMLVSAGKVVNKFAGPWVQAIAAAARAIADFFRDLIEKSESASESVGTTTGEIKENAKKVVDFMVGVGVGLLELSKGVAGLTAIWLADKLAVAGLIVVYRELAVAYNVLRDMFRGERESEATKKARTALAGAKALAGDIYGLMAKAYRWIVYGADEAGDKLRTAAETIKGSIDKADMSLGGSGKTSGAGDEGGGGGGRNPNPWGRKELAETVLSIERAIYQIQMAQLEAYSRVGDKLKTTYQTIQQIIGGRLDQGVQDAISRLGTMGVASNQLIRTASRRGDNEIVLKLNWSGDTPEAARKAAVEWLLPTLQRAAGAGGAVAH